MTAAPKFTPGPWVVRPCYDASRDGGYAEIGSANLSGDGDYVALVYAERDTAVLAAAPELYEALRGMLAIHDSVTQGQEKELRDKWIPAARAALAKVTP